MLKEIWYTMIENNNKFRNEYIKTIKRWNVDGNFINLLQNSPFIAVFYNDLFLGAVIINEGDELDRKPLTINGSIQHYDEINQALLDFHRVLIKKYEKL